MNFPEEAYFSTSQRQLCALSSLTTLTGVIHVCCLWMPSPTKLTIWTSFWWRLWMPRLTQLTIWTSFSCRSAKSVIRWIAWCRHRRVFRVLRSVRWEGCTGIGAAEWVHGPGAWVVCSRSRCRWMRYTQVDNVGCSLTRCHDLCLEIRYSSVCGREHYDSSNQPSHKRKMTRYRTWTGMRHSPWFWPLWTILSVWLFARCRYSWGFPTYIPACSDKTRDSSKAGQSYHDCFFDSILLRPLAWEIKRCKKHQWKHKPTASKE